jgi:hypothetical protein
MWRAYQETGGGKLPFLFFGIKSYRLLNWSGLAVQRGETWRYQTLRWLRFCWRYYVFVPALSSLVIVLSMASVRLPETAEIALLTISIAMVVGMLAIAAEAVLAALVLGSWAVLYHRWRNPGTENAPLREFTLFVGCVLLTALTVFALVLCAQMRFHAYQDTPAGIGWLPIRDAFVTSFTGFVSDALSQSGGPLAFFVNLLTGISFLSYFIFLSQAGARLWGS